MPVAHVHLPADTFDDQRCRRMLLDLSEVYARILDSPIERVRVFLEFHPPSAVAVGGRIVAEGGPPAPFFTAIVLAGRPESQRRDLLRAFTDTLVDCLGVDRSLVRGRIIEVAPANWGIAGDTAAETRAAEIAARAGRD